MGNNKNLFGDFETVKTTPIVKWIGGKRRLAKHILPKFPEHLCYVEVFAGGAALYFLRDQQAEVEVINDINGELVNLYRVVKNHIEEFLRQFKYALSSRQIFEWLKMTPSETLTDIQRAARFFYLQQHAFGGKVGNQTFGTAATRPAINLMRIEEHLSEAHLRLAGTYIEHLDWAKCISKYDRPHTLFYCDPPYWDTEGYGVDFGLEQYHAIADTLKTIQGKAILSLNDHPRMLEIFKDFRLETVQINYTVGGSGKKSVKRNELIIYNW
ncbi:DNA adenine methylase [Oxalobacter paraformigenes]|uniref:site-specific DNA-methyltransferase (adenine-specific) n=1 Tax=Oxalobacter paraformigenes TaxID=556268 RepID=C3X338_9BURK|nr:DNA adenine methylase [Oxalobacter paraformigenes]EEO27624.1 DNA adenine methylase [Oxalobacter paraformigenes]